MWEDTCRDACVGGVPAIDHCVGLYFCVCVCMCMCVCACKRERSCELVEFPLEKQRNSADLAVKKEKKKDNNLFIAVIQISLNLLLIVQLLSQ